ncbi:MAG: dephospho-CoA kinase [Bacillota bacterium]|nr:dephospho-CoA kinase [Bacillota bacterium]
MRRVIGLTGGIGAGKSAAALYFKNKGATIIDADQLAREVTAPGMPALTEIEASFNGVVKDGILDRRALGKIVFNNPAKMKLLEKITHKYINERFKELIDSEDGIIILDAPLLFEAGAEKFCDIVIFVKADENVRKQRITERDNLTEQETESRIAARNLEPCMKKSDFIVDNSGSITELYARLDEILRRI